jgi:prepilin-type N-terminal cleavage/methylation domain-containing protein
MPRSLRHTTGFTLIELLVVVAIIGLLMSMTTMGIFKALEKGKIGRVKGDLKHIADAVDAYRIDFDTAPPDIYDLLSQQDLDDDPTTLGETPSHVIYLQRLDLGNEKLTSFYDVFSDPEAPYVYLPAYSKNADVIQKFLRDNNYDPKYLMFADLLNEVKTNLRKDLRLPPRKFDVFVIMSTGPHDPEQVFGGLKPDMSDIDVENGLTTEELADIRMRRLTAYVLATLDKNDNYYLDYDFDSRSRRNDGIRPDGQPDLLPNGTALSGPMIKTGG